MQEDKKRQEASAAVVRLTEMKALLQQQLEETGGGSVADKQVCVFTILQQVAHVEYDTRLYIGIQDFVIQ